MSTGVAFAMLDAPREHNLRLCATGTVQEDGNAMEVAAHAWGNSFVPATTVSWLAVFEDPLN